MSSVPLRSEVEDRTALKGAEGWPVSVYGCYDNGAC